jgi:hypothetical protein
VAQVSLLRPGVLQEGLGPIPIEDAQVSGTDGVTTVLFIGGYSGVCREVSGTDGVTTVLFIGGYSGVCRE